MSESIHVIVADDEPMLRRGLARLIGQHDPEWRILGTFANGVEALDFIRTTEERVDLLVTDVKMPEMDGLRLIKEAKAHQAILPLVISGYDDFEYVRTALREGVIDYVLKPIDREAFAVQLSEIKKKIRRKRYAEEVEAIRGFWLGGVGVGQDAGVANGRRRLPDGPFRLLCVSPDEPPSRMRGYTEQYWKLIHYAVHNIVEECVRGEAGAGGDGGWTWQEGGGNVWALLRDAEAAEETAERIRGAVNRYLGLTVTVACGSEFDELATLAEYRNEALTLLYLRPMYGGNRVFSKERLFVSPPESDIGARLHAIGERLRVAVLQDDERDTVRLLGDCFDDIAALQEPSDLEKAVEYVLLQIAGLLLVGGHRKAKALMQAELGQAHAWTSSFHRLRKRLEELALQAAALLREGRSGTERTPIERAKSYIRARLSEPITIQSIADHIPMSPTYFCELFKVQTGETVHDYIRGKRMEEAAKLLLETDAKLQDVAERVGYKDVKYFSRQFRKHFGALPSKYKELHPFGASGGAREAGRGRREDGGGPE